MWSPDFPPPNIAPLLIQFEGPTGTVKQFHDITNSAELFFLQEHDKINQAPLIYPDEVQMPHLGD